MLKGTLTIAALTLSTWQCFGAAPIATVSSSESIVVSGITVPTNRVISWPVALHDEVATQGSSAMVRFSDGSTVTLQRNSRMRLEADGSGIQFKVLAGSAIYDVKPHSNISLAPVGSTVQIARSSAASFKNSLPPPSRNETVATAMASSAAVNAPSQGGIVLAPATGAASFGGGKSPLIRTQPGVGTDKIFLANGTILEVHLVSGGFTSTYVIDKVEFATTVDGNTVYVAPARGFQSPLIGGTVQLPQLIPGGSTVNLIITPVSSGTPLTPDQLTGLLNQAATSAFSDPNSLLPAGTNPPAFPSPVSTGTFSGHG